MIQINYSEGCDIKPVTVEDVIKNAYQRGKEIGIKQGKKEANEVLIMDKEAMRLLNSMLCMQADSKKILDTCDLFYREDCLNANQYTDILIVVQLLKKWGLIE